MLVGFPAVHFGVTSPSATSGIESFPLKLERLSSSSPTTVSTRRGSKRFKRSKKKKKKCTQNGQDYCAHKYDHLKYDRYVRPQSKREAGCYAGEIKETRIKTTPPELHLEGGWGRATKAFTATSANRSDDNPSILLPFSVLSLIARARGQRLLFDRNRRMQSSRSVTSAPFTRKPRSGEFGGEAVTERQKINREEWRRKKKTETGLSRSFFCPVPRTSQRKQENNRLLSRYLSKKTARLPSVMLVAASETSSRADDSASLLQQTVCTVNDTKRRVYAGSIENEASCICGPAKWTSLRKVALSLSELPFDIQIQPLSFIEHHPFCKRRVYAFSSARVVACVLSHRRTNYAGEYSHRQMK